jgi:tripartite-type tricarboxylate transporter receptor subunit TctC
MKALFRLAGAVAVLLLSTAAAAQNFPDKPIRIVVPYPPGASTDMLARLVGKKLSENVGQPVIVDNRGGANGAIGSTFVSRSAPDGYTILVGTSSSHIIVKYLSKVQPYDTLKDFTPLTAAVEIPIALVVHPSVPARTATELVDYAKKAGTKLSYGSSGTGSAHHLAGEQFKQLTGIEMTHVPYKGGTPALQDLLGGQIPVLFTTLATAVPFLDSGKLRVLGMVENKRTSIAPNIPAVSETVPGYAAPSTWLGFFGPPNLPPAITAKLNAELLKALRDPEIKAKLHADGLIVIGSTPAEFEKIIRSDLGTVQKIVTGAGIQPE